MENLSEKSSRETGLICIEQIALRSFELRTTTATKCTTNGACDEKRGIQMIIVSTNKMMNSRNNVTIHLAESLNFDNIHIPCMVQFQLFNILITDSKTMFCDESCEMVCEMEIYTMAYAMYWMPYIIVFVLYNFSSIYPPPYS